MIEGKTKQLQPGPRPGTLLVTTKDELTGGDAAKRANISGIAAHKTTQTANVFQLLEKHQIPTAFLEQQGPTSFLCQSCEMLPLECVMRRYAWGSFLKREPDYQQETPYRFGEIRTELFHKWSVVMPPLSEKPEQLPEEEARARYLKDGIWKQGVYTDPLTIPGSAQWQVHPPKVPVAPQNPLMMIDPVCSDADLDIILNQLMIPCFSALEQAWAKVETKEGPVVLADMKIEIGKTEEGQWVIADVIDNDSWRIWPGGDPKLQLDKQSFRDGDPLNEVADRYALVAELTQQFVS